MQSVLLTPGVDLDGEEVRGADLSRQSADGGRIVECLVEDCDLDEADLHRTRVVETTLRRCRAGSLSATDGVWQDVVVEGCRFGAVAAHGLEATRLTLRGGKIDYLNLRDAELTDVTLAHVVVGELDLAGARVRRLRLDGCTVRRLDVTGATLEDVDLRGADLARLDGVGSLRGARVSEEQLVALAPHLAAFVGLEVG